MDAIRAFVALEIGTKVRARLAEAMAWLRPQLAGVRWVRPEGVHLTLRFLGPSRPAVLDALRAELATAAAGCPVSEAGLAGLGVFPERGAPRVLWLGLRLAPQVLGLQRACEAAAVAHGYPAEARTFQPHLTLGRWRERAPRPAMPELDLGTARLEHLVLFRSDLRPGGAVYTPLSEFPLVQA